jgi:hypothetical protein
VTALEVVLATGPGKPPEVRFLSTCQDWFGSCSGQNPDPGSLGDVVTAVGHILAVF